MLNISNHIYIQLIKIEIGNKVSYTTCSRVKTKFILQGVAAKEQDHLQEKDSDKISIQRTQ